MPQGSLDVIVIGGGIAGLRETLAPDDPEHGLCSLVFPRYRAPGADPAHHGIQIVSPATWEHGDTWQAGPALERGDAYRDFKRDYAARMIRRAEERLPGLSDHIVALDVATPLTMHRYTLNYQGAPVGWGYNNPLRWTPDGQLRPGAVPGRPLGGAIGGGQRGRLRPTRRRTGPTRQEIVPSDWTRHAK